MTNDLMTIFLALCDPLRGEIPGDISQQSWKHISELSKLHGVSPFLYYRARSLGIKLPEQIEKEWLGIYLYQIAEEKKARRQIKELKEILDPKGIPFILLKGASAMLRLYPQPGLRTFVDLDILIPADVTPRFKQAMMTAGYKPLSARNSPEDEELQKFDVHLDPFWKEEGMMIEPHLNILGAKGHRLAALPEIWDEKEETNNNQVIISHLSKEHFIIHTLLHCMKHLSEEGFVEIKWFIDLLFAIRTWKIDWSEVMDVSYKWGVEKEILCVIATMNHYWHTNISLPGKVEPLDLSTLVLGIEDQEKKYCAKIPGRYFNRLLRLRELSDTSSQVRYLLHLFFPNRENLRHRYNISINNSVLPYYLLHPLVISKKFLTGLWYQFFYHPQ